MSQAFAVETTIEQPADVVWATLTDWARMPEWMNGLDRAALEGPAQEGATLTFHARGKDRTSTLTRFEPDRALTLRSVQGSVTADYRYTLTPGDAGTHVSLVADCSAGGLWRLLWPLLKVAIRSADGGQLEALKTLVETPAPSAKPG